MKVFVYGSLMSNYENHHVMEEANGKFISKALTSDKIFDLMGVNDYYPTIVKGNRKIYGEIYEVDDEGIEILNRLEGYPNFYDKKEFSFDTENGKINALMYVMTNNSLKYFGDKYIKDSKRIHKTDDYSLWMLRDKS